MLNLARIYSQRGEDGKAEQLLRETIKNYPQYASAKINLGMNLVKQGRNAEAEPLLAFDKAAADTLAKSYPHTWSAALNLAHLRYEAKETGAALDILDEAIARSPDIWDLVRFKAQIVQETSGAAAAAAVVQAYADAHWWDYDSHFLLGRLQLTANDRMGIETLRNAAWLDIHAADPFSLIAQYEFRAHRPEAALTMQTAAIHRRPGQPSRYYLLAVILEELGRKSEAAEAVRTAERLAHAS